jgi:hypothetical protein
MLHGVLTFLLFQSLFRFQTHFLAIGSSAPFPVVKPRQSLVQFFGMLRYNDLKFNNIKIEKINGRKKSDDPQRERSH